MTKIRILIVDDHFVVRMGLIRSFEMESDLAVIGEAATAEEAIDLYPKLLPDITLMDLRLPVMGALKPPGRSADDFPKPGSSSFRPTTAKKKGFIRPSGPVPLLSFQGRNSVRSASHNTLGACGRSVSSLPLSPRRRLAERVRHPQMSPRELDVLNALAKGGSNKEIAVQLSISEFTVKMHVRALLSKLGVSDRSQAITVAIKRGIIHLPEC